MEKPYSSIPETEIHRQKVEAVLIKISQELIERGRQHDQSKKENPEVEVFDVETPKLKELVYGTPEYTASLKRLGPALAHHYKVNRHHPEHFECGVVEMTLVDLVEMFADWVAASQRTKDGNIYKSIFIGVSRFKMDPQLAEIFENTARETLNLKAPDPKSD